MTRNAILTAPLVLCAAVAACGDSSGPSSDIPLDQPSAQYIVVKRAWAPGERDSTISYIVTNRTWTFPYVGDVSDLAPAVYSDPDSVAEMVSNPSFAVPSAPSGLVLSPRFDNTFTVQGIDYALVNANTTPRDTLHWVGVLWYKPTEPTWKGMVLASVPFSQATVPQTSVKTGNFDAGGGKSGAGAGEARGLTYYLEAAGTGNPGAGNNTITISSASYGAASTVTTGPFLGGTQQAGTMLGRLRTIIMTLAAGTGPASDTVDVDFSVTSISAVKLVCAFPTPCTTNVPIILGAVRRPESWGATTRGGAAVGR